MTLNTYNTIYITLILHLTLNKLTKFNTRRELFHKFGPSTQSSFLAVTQHKTFVTQ